jgi:dihydroorotate dehydrogenase
MSNSPSRVIDLAPGNPYTLVLHSPVLMAPGCAVRDLELAELGALVTRTATRHTRHEPAPRFAPTPAGLVVTGFPTVSIRTLIKEDARQWERSTIPVIVSLQGAPDELAEMAGMLENVESVSGLLLAPEVQAATATAAVRRVTQRPILVLLDPSNLQPTAQQTVAAGADALVVAAPTEAAGGADLLEGYLLGPAALPLTLRALREARAVVGVPLVAFGGVATVEHARQALAAGATALMIDAARWGDPQAPAVIAQGLGVRVR